MLKSDFILLKDLSLNNLEKNIDNESNEKLIFTPSISINILIISFSIGIIYCNNVSISILLTMFLIIAIISKIYIVYNSINHHFEIINKNFVDNLIQSLEDKCTKKINLKLITNSSKTEDNEYFPETIETTGKSYVLQNNVLYSLKIKYYNFVKEPNCDFFKNEMNRLSKIYRTEKLYMGQITFDVCPSVYSEHNIFYRSSMQNLPFIIKYKKILLLGLSILGLENIYGYYLKKEFVYKEICIKNKMIINKV